MLIREASALIRLQARQAGFNERQWLAPSNQEDWQHVSALYNNLDLFNQRKIIEIHIPNGKPSAYGQQQLQRYIQQPLDDHIVIITTRKNR